MSEICKVDLRRPDGTVLARWFLPPYSTLVYNPPLGRAPLGLVEWWLDDGAGFQRVGEPFEYDYGPMVVEWKGVNLTGIRMEARS